MKINLSLTKKKDGKANGELQEIKKKQVERMFSTSDDEETYAFESSQNKKIEENEKQRIEEEIKDFIHEHEHEHKHNSEENRRRKESKEREEKKKNFKKKIVYLGYKGKELTNFKRGKEEHSSENESSDERCSQSSSSAERKTDRRRREKKQRELQHAEREKERTYEKKSYLYNQKTERRREKKCNDPVPSELFVDPRRKDVNVDETFKKVEEKKNKEDHKNEEEKPKSQYINALINSAKRRKLEKEMLIQKKLKIDSEKKEKVFITSAYKKIMMDRELIKQEILKEEEEKEKEKKEGQRNFNLSTFYKNINAPSNYDRMNRKNYSYDKSNESDY